MKGYKTQKFEKPLVLSVDSLSNFINQIHLDGELHIGVECSDGTKLYPENLEELSTFPNPESSRIVALTLRSPFSSGNRFSVEFSNALYSAPASFTVEGDASYISATSKTILDHIESMVGNKPFFLSTSFFVRNLLSTLFLVLTLTLAVSSLTYLVLDIQHGIPARAPAIMLLVGTGGAVLSSQVDRALRYFFPRAVFRIGAGVARYDNMRTARTRFSIAALASSLMFGILVRVLWALANK